MFFLLSSAITAAVTGPVGIGNYGPGFAGTLNWTLQSRWKVAGGAVRTR